MGGVAIRGRYDEGVGQLTDPEPVMEKWHTACFESALAYAEEKALSGGKMLYPLGREQIDGLQIVVDGVKIFWFM